MKAHTLSLRFKQAEQSGLFLIGDVPGSNTSYHTERLQDPF